MPYCPSCGFSSPAYANFCPICGYSFREIKIKEVERMARKAMEVKKPRDVALLAAAGGPFLMGLGHIYMHEKKRGLALLLLSGSLLFYTVTVIWTGLIIQPFRLPWPIPLLFFISLVTFTVLVVVIWAWQTLDAYKLATSKAKKATV
jgi:hypothetical protein